MQYKVRYRPLERLTAEGWVRMPAQQQERLIAAAAHGRRGAAVRVDGSGKDGVPGGQDQYLLND